LTTQFIGYFYFFFRALSQDLIIFQVWSSGYIQIQKFFNEQDLIFVSGLARRWIVYPGLSIAHSFYLPIDLTRRCTHLAFNPGFHGPVPGLARAPGI
jgi:hypothetical protein